MGAWVAWLARAGPWARLPDSLVGWALAIGGFAVVGLVLGSAGRIAGALVAAPAGFLFQRERVWSSDAVLGSLVVYLAWGGSLGGASWEEGAWWSVPVLFVAAGLLVRETMDLRVLVRVHDRVEDQEAGGDGSLAGVEALEVEASEPVRRGLVSSAVAAVSVVGAGVAVALGVGWIRRNVGEVAWWEGIGVVGLTVLLLALFVMGGVLGGVSVRSWLQENAS